MNWYAGNDTDRVIVPDSKETSNAHSSWWKWVDCGPEDSGVSIATDPYLISKEYNLPSNCSVDKVLMENLPFEKDHFSGSSVCRGSSEDFLRDAVLSYDSQDFQQDDLSQVKEIDDILWYKCYLT